MEKRKISLYFLGCYISAVVLTIMAVEIYINKKIDRLRNEIQTTLLNAFDTLNWCVDIGKAMDKNDYPMFAEDTIPTTDWQSRDWDRLFGDISTYYKLKTTHPLYVDWPLRNIAPWNLISQKIDFNQSDLCLSYSIIFPYAIGFKSTKHQSITKVMSDSFDYVTGNPKSPIYNNFILGSDKYIHNQVATCENEYFKIELSDDYRKHSPWDSIRNPLYLIITSQSYYVYIAETEPIIHKIRYIHTNKLKDERVLLIIWLSLITIIILTVFGYINKKINL